MAIALRLARVGRREADRRAAAGCGLGLVLLVNGLSLPALWRLMRADGLRTE